VLPTTVDNEIESDSVAFIFSFVAEQARHNDAPVTPFVDTFVGAGDSIQAAVDAASTGDVVGIAAATFTEQVTVSVADLTLIDRAGARIYGNGGSAPVTIATTATGLGESTLGVRPEDIDIVDDSLRERADTLRCFGRLDLSHRVTSKLATMFGRWTMANGGMSSAVESRCEIHVPTEEDTASIASKQVKTRLQRVARDRHLMAHNRIVTFGLSVVEEASRSPREPDSGWYPLATVDIESRIQSGRLLANRRAIVFSEYVH
jgi:hypothetical protein